MKILRARSAALSRATTFSCDLILQGARMRSRFSQFSIEAGNRTPPLSKIFIVANLSCTLRSLAMAHIRNKHTAAFLALNTLKKRKKQLLLMSCNAIVASVQYLRSHVDKIPKNTSKMSGRDYIGELRAGHPDSFRSVMGMSKHVFDRLLMVLQEHGGVNDTKHLESDEQLAIFLYIITTGQSN